MAIVPFRLFRDVSRPTDDPFSSFQREMNRLVENFFSEDWAQLSKQGSPAFTPQIDFVEGEKDFTVTAELPGIDEKELDVSVNENVLTIRGEKKWNHEEKGRNFVHVERRYGSFYRSVPLPSEIDESKVEATFKNGVLTVRLPKSPAAVKEAKKIQIKSGS